MVLGFPCDQFGGQEPASDEKVAEFCQLHYGVDFQLMQKSDVNGDNANEVFQYLKSQRSSFGLTRIKWNFEKFLIDRHGNVVSRRFSMRGPTGMEADIQKLLAEQP
ncbi:hypothetical protein FRB97_000627 [Tulasnella sp. 331]|nr:hypothetical protein FRB97_000627 [Tulasnella sp. 331]KAG8871055.1 hypothetical protein FRB98_001085 [Tulasnella sp. 332]